MQDLLERSSVGGNDDASPKKQYLKPGHNHTQSQEEIDAGKYASDLVERLSVRRNLMSRLCTNGLCRNKGMMIMTKKRKKKNCEGLKIKQNGDKQI